MDKAPEGFSWAGALRFLLLFAPTPLAVLLAGAQEVLFFVVCFSVLAVCLDSVRKRQKCIPFPIYLMLVYALQLSSTLMMPLGSGAGEPFGHAAWTEAGASQGVTLVQPDSRRVHGGPQASEEGGGQQAVQAPPEIRTMSIVMAAHNEHKYMKRTLDSIYEMTPKKALVEIIVVDDGSDPPMATALTDNPEVKVLRHEERRGLIKSKTEGGNMAIGDMIMFLDCHIKPEKDWYKSIIGHMNLNYKRIVVPLIPILDPETWMPNDNAVGVKMMFDWTLFFQWFDDGNDLVPCMSGGLFGITRKWWHESGEYDYGMMMWGSENIEQSIRVWLCGGEIYVARDSRVAHVFRRAFPYKINNTEIYINKVRTVETWFDEYKENYYESDPAARQYIAAVGNISDRLALKKSLHCKPFRDYVEKFKAVFKEKHMLPEDVFLIRDSNTGLCLQVTIDHMHLTEAECDTDLKLQLWSHKKDLEGLRNIGANKCLDADAGRRERVGTLVLMYQCYQATDMQAWAFQGGHVSWRDFCLQEAVGPNPPKDENDEEQPMTFQRCDGGFLQKRGPFAKHLSRAFTYREQQELEKDARQHRR